MDFHMKHMISSYIFCMSLPIGLLCKVPEKRIGVQAVEAKEGVEIQNETVTLASISYQNFFRSYTVWQIQSHMPTVLG